jgi:hypothetical protein
MYTAVLAKTVKKSAVPPLEIQILLPLSTHDLPSGDKTAFNDTDPASDPLPVSVKANAANNSPDANLGKYLAFCSSVPYNKIP